MVWWLATRNYMVWLTKCYAYSDTTLSISLAATMGKGCKKNGKDGKVQDGKEDGKVKDGKVKGGKEDGKDGKDQIESSCYGGLQAVDSCSAFEQWYFRAQRWVPSLEGKGGEKGGEDGKKGDYLPVVLRTPPLGALLRLSCNRQKKTRSFVRISQY